MYAHDSRHRDALAFGHCIIADDAPACRLADKGKVSHVASAGAIQGSSQGCMKLLLWCRQPPRPCCPTCRRPPSRCGLQPCAALHACPWTRLHRLTPLLDRRVGSCLPARPQPIGCIGGWSCCVRQAIWAGQVTALVHSLQDSSTDYRHLQTCTVRGVNRRCHLSLAVTG